MMINLKLLDYLILMLLLLKGLLCKHHRTSHYSSEEPPASNNNKLGDLESDYFKIFSDIKDMRSKVPDYYNTDITFDSEKAFSLLRDPVTYKRASIMNPIDPFDNVYTGANDDESTTRDQNDRILKALMDFQKRQDDPMHQTHGVGEGLASLPTTKKSKDGKLTTAENFMGSAKDTKSSRDGDSPKISEEGKTKIYASDSLGMVRQSIEHPAAEKNNTLNNTMVVNTTESSHVRNRTEPNSNLTASQNSSTAESAPIKNVTDSFNNTSNIPPLLFQALKNLAVDNDTTTTASTALMSDNTTANTTSNDSSSIVSNVTTRNMITDATIKGFLARSDSFTIYDVGKRTTKTYNDTASFPAKMSSNFVEVRSNISYAEQENTTTHSDSVNSNSTSNITRDAASYSPDNVTVSTMTAANNTSKDVNNETIASKLAQMLGNDPKTSVHKGEAHQNEADVKGEAKTLIQQHVHHFYSPVHLTKVTDEMRSGHETSRLDASPFTESTMARKKDNIKAVFQPECTPDKPCPGNKYCRHFECFDCHNKHHECIADEQCCDKMPCIYGRCDKKPKKSPGAICKNDGDCADGCCVLEPTINVETGICKIKLAEFHQCSPVLYRKVWIGDKKPACGPCEDGLECTNKGVVATHLVCMKKK